MYVLKDLSLKALATNLLFFIILSALFGCGGAPVDDLGSATNTDDFLGTKEPTFAKEDAGNLEEEGSSGEAVSDDDPEKVTPGTWELFLPEDELLAENIQLAKPYLIYGLKEGFFTTVYSKSITDGSEKVILTFEENSAAKLSGNLWQGLPPSFSLSEDGLRIAYVDTVGLKLFSLQNGQSENVVEIIKPGDDMEIAPIWSNDSMNTAYPIQAIFQPRWSADGEYICFLQAYWEGNSYGFIGVNTNYYTGYPISAYGSVVGGPIGHSFLIASSDDYSALRGLFATFPDDVNEIRKLDPETWQWSEKLYGEEVYDAYPFHQANYAPDGGKIVYIYSKYEDQELYNLAMIDSDGSNLTSLKQGGLKNLMPFFAPDGETLFYYRSLNGQSVLTGYNLGSNEKVDLLVLPPETEYNVWKFLSWTDEGYLVLQAFTNSYHNYRAGERARLVMLDLKRKEIVYASPAFVLFTSFAGLLPD